MTARCKLCGCNPRVRCQAWLARPACFDTDAEWLGWNKDACSSKLKNGSYCTDCTPEHQATMIRAQRCENPGVTFHLRRYVRAGHVEHELVGLLPGQSLEEEIQEHAA